MKKYFILLITALGLVSCEENPSANSYYQEPFRLQYHFSPQAHWMNDPNGLVYIDGNYHLFYQYYPDDVVWGPMHWGHAISKDLVRWQHEPIALYPDALGYIFSGSAVLDKHNSSDFGSLENPPLIAVYTYHDPVKEKAGTKDEQYQGMAFSLDQGTTWTKYKHNPIIPNENQGKDFRDPKIFWNEQISSWTIALVAGDHVQFWKSEDLKSWTRMSEFGKELGAHGGVWECPDIFEIQVEGTDQTKWVLSVSINPGGPNGGSATQYFVGDFDGWTFSTDQKETKWVDGGSDNYAGVTYNNEPNNERIFIGWMSNWDYAQEIPTQTWRSSMTLTRKLTLKEIDGDLILCSLPVKAYESIVGRGDALDISIRAGEKTNMELSDELQSSKISLRITTKTTLIFDSVKGEQLQVTLDPKGQIVVDRTQSGLVDFKDNFARVIRSDFKGLHEVKFELYLDASSLEVFVDDGRRAVTTRHFNTEDFSKLTLVNESGENAEIKDFSIQQIQSIWN